MKGAAWSDWLTESFFRVRVSGAAAEKLRALPAAIQQRLQQMLHDIAELADLVPPQAASNWRPGDALQLLQLQLGRVTVRYSINEESRTLAVEHVIAPDDLVAPDEAIDQGAGMAAVQEVAPVEEVPTVEQVAAVGAVAAVEGVAAVDGVAAEAEVLPEGGGLIEPS